jgi:hypothetical protein
LHSELLSIRIEDAGKLVILRVDIARGARMPLRHAIELFVGYLSLPQSCRPSPPIGT